MFLSNSLKMKTFVILSAVLKVCETLFNVGTYIAWNVWKQWAAVMLVPVRQKWQEAGERHDEELHDMCCSTAMKSLGSLCYTLQC